MTPEQFQELPIEEKIKQIKAHAYDAMVQIEFLKNTVNEAQREIANLSQQKSSSVIGSDGSKKKANK